MIVTPFGEYSDSNQQINSSALHRAIKKYKDDIVKIMAYRNRLLYRYASRFCFVHWRPKV